MIEDLIYDLGMHKGEDTEFYLRKGFRVVAIEAMKPYCAEVEKRLSEFVATGKLQIVNAAISDEDKEISFFENVQTSVWGTTKPNWAERNRRLGTDIRETKVQGIRFEKILERYGIPYYLKIDIEGNDRLCLSALQNFSDRPKYISIESEKESWKLLEWEIETLAKMGYNKFKAIQQEDVAKISCPVPALEGESIEHIFALGSSGPFGKELPGSWCSKEEILRLYRKIFWRYRLVGDNGWLILHKKFRGALKRSLGISAGWYDTHAMRD